MVTLGLASWLIGPAVGLFVLVSVILVLMVLIQKPQGGGLGGAFGASSGSGQTAFGAKTGDVLTITTVSIFALWLVFAVGLNFAVRPMTATPAAAVMGAVGAPKTAGDDAPTPDDSAPTNDPSQSQGSSDAGDQDGDGSDATDSGDDSGSADGQGG